MNARECVLLVDDDPLVTEALTMLLERPGRTTIVCSDLESAEMILELRPVTHVLTDVQFSGSFGFEGLHFLSRVHVQRPECRIVLMSGFTSEALRNEASAMGAAAVLQKPFGYAEIEEAFGCGPDTDLGEEYSIVRVPGIGEVLHGGILSVAFQPIVDFHAKGQPTIAFEALTRIRGTWPAGGVAELFDYAARKGRLADLNLAAIECAVADAEQLPRDASLFLNVDPHTFDSGELTAALLSVAARHSFPLSRMVLEITERSALGRDGTALRAFSDLRGHGIRFALDDQGSAYSHLSAINDIRPSFVKISNTFGTGFESDPTQTRIVRHVLDLARDFGCRTVLEGIETAATARAAAAFGIDLGQGYHLGRPAPVSHWGAQARAAA